MTLAVPGIDAEIGIELYGTQFPGLGRGFRIRASLDDFEVREVLARKALESFKVPGAQIARDGGPSGGPGAGTGYAVYVLRKRGIDTAHALSAILDMTGARLKALGLKDSSAVTEQFVCSTGAAGRRLKDISTPKFGLRFAGYAKKPITKKQMLGNAFRITISGDWEGAGRRGGSGPHGGAADPACFVEHADSVPNFYGYQRFGSRRPVTHLVGREIARRNFAEAVRLILEFDSPHDTSERREVRQSLAGSASSPQSCSRHARRLPPGMDVERIVLEGLGDHGDPLRALRAVPLQLRRLYVGAYQSYLFNRTLGAAIAQGEDLMAPLAGDVCFDRGGNLSKQGAAGSPAHALAPGGGGGGGGAATGDSIRARDASVAIPMVGYSYYAKTRFAPYVSSLLEEEAVLPRDFFIKEMQEVSGEGGFRDALVQCSGYSWDDTCKTAEFSLIRGSFATMVLREMIKPPDPIAAGF